MEQNEVIKVKVDAEYAVNEETGKRYELRPSKYKQFPHLQKLKDEIKETTFGSAKYWKLRCEYLEKALDETYSVFERENCNEFWRMLRSKS